jgi:ABC 3 transport family
MRWEAAGLRNRPRTAAAVAVALERMPGIVSVEATPRTGRLLVRYDANLTVEVITSLVEAALYAAAPTPEATEALLDQTADGGDEAVPLRWAHTGRRHHARAPAAMLRGGRGRRLLLAGLMQVHRMPVRLLGVLFLLWLALAVTVSSTATGVLLVVALVMIPTAAAQLLTVHLVRLLVYATGFAVCSVCLGLWLAAQTHWLLSFCMALSSFAWYVGVRALVSWGGRAHPRPARKRVPGARQRP